MMDGSDLNIYNNCGYDCIDNGMVMDKHREAYIRILKEVDLIELKETLSYFDNFDYCVKLSTEELKVVHSELKKTINMERAGRKRELFRNMLSIGYRKKVESLFISRLAALEPISPCNSVGYQYNLSDGDLVSIN